MPKRLQPRAKDLLHEATLAPERVSAEEAIVRVASDYRGAYPKAAACLTEGQDKQLTLFHSPAQHWLHPHHQSD